MWQIAAAQAASSAFGSYIGGFEKKAQQYRAETQVKLSKMQGQAAAMKLGDSFNKTMASNAVMAAAQGRRGGSVNAIASAATAQYNWDVDFADLNSKLEQIGFKSQADAYAAAAKYSQGIGMLTAAGGSLLGSYSQISSIGGSTKKTTKVDDGTLYKGGASGWYNNN